MSAHIAWRRRGVSPAVALALAGALTGAAIAVIAMMALSSARARTATSPNGSPPAAESVAAGPAEGPGKSDLVALSPAAMDEAKIRIEECRLGPASRIVEVAGTIEADHDLYVPIRPRTVGVARQVLANVGQKRKKGDVLAYIDSAEVATARLELITRIRERDVAKADADWKATVAANVEALVQAIRRNVPVQEIQRKFADKPLGQQRAALMSAYSDFQTGAIEERKQTDLARDRIVGQPKAAAAIRQRAASESALESALEQIRYDARRNRALSEQDARKAEANIVDARKKLEVLGAAAPEMTMADEDLTLVAIVAPFDGVVLDRPIAPGQRVTPDDVLFPFADTSRVHVVAHVPESQIGLLPALDQGLTFVVTSYPGAIFQAKVHAVGSDIDPKTRTARILADAPNLDGRLKLGSFIKIRLAQPTPEPVLTVPASAVVEIEGRTLVFTPGDEPGSFVKRSVRAGELFGDRRAILSGLKPGEKVASGAISLLKHELILSNEPEEE